MAIFRGDERFLLRCEEIKRSSYDPHRKVGVVIVRPPGEILVEGVNAPPAALGLTPHETELSISKDPSWKYFFLEHAERNAIFSARDKGISIIGATMYGTLFPCADCARAIVASGISRLVISATDGDPVRDEKWQIHYNYARHIFDMGGVIVDVAGT